MTPALSVADRWNRFRYLQTVELWLDSMPGRRRRAVLALGVLNDAQAVAMLTRALNDPDATVRRTAAGAAVVRRERQQADAQRRTCDGSSDAPRDALAQEEPARDGHHRGDRRHDHAGRNRAGQAHAEEHAD